VEEGNVLVKYSNNEKLIKKEKNLFLFNPNQVHKTENIDGKGYYILFLNSLWCESIQYSIFKEKCILDYSMDYQRKTNNEFISICREILFNDCKNKEILLFSFLKKFYNDYSKTCEINKKNDRIISIVDQYIDTNLNQNLSTRDISLYLGYDKSYFIRFFKKKTGITPNNYIINKKVEEAKEILLHPHNIDIADIAQELGFYDQSHLNRNFKKIFAVSPSKYID